jgi:hypothetical protein
MADSEGKGYLKVEGTISIKTSLLRRRSRVFAIMMAMQSHGGTEWVTYVSRNGKWEFQSLESDCKLSKMESCLAGDMEICDKSGRCKAPREVVNKIWSPNYIDEDKTDNGLTEIKFGMQRPFFNSDSKREIQLG